MNNKRAGKSLSLSLSLSRLISLCVFALLALISYTCVTPHIKAHADTNSDNVLFAWDDASKTLTITGSNDPANPADASAEEIHAQADAHKSDMTTVDFEGCIQITDTQALTSAGIFESCSALTMVSAETGASVSFQEAEASLLSLFYGCRALTSLDGLSAWNTQAVTDMRYMFYGCAELTSLDDLSAWNTQAVTDMCYMFNNCQALKSLDGLSAWNTEKVTTTKSMFYGCSALTSLDGLSAWNTEKVTDMSNMFRSCAALISLDGLSAWNTEKVTDMSNMFENCRALASLNGLSAWKTGKVSNMNSMFYGCSALKSLDGLSAWDTGAVTSMSSMFQNCPIDSLTLKPGGFQFKGNNLALPRDGQWYEQNDQSNPVDTTTLYGKQEGHWARSTTGSTPYVDVQSLTIDWKPLTYSTYTGIVQNAQPEIKHGETTLQQGTDYRVAYTKDSTQTNCIQDAGSYTAQIVLQGKWVDKRTDAEKQKEAQSYTLSTLNLSETVYSPEVVCVPDVYAWDGTPKEPEVLVKLTLGENAFIYLPKTDYTTTYKNNKDKGIADASVIGTGDNVSGNKTGYFSIVGDATYTVTLNANGGIFASTGTDTETLTVRDHQALTDKLVGKVVKGEQIISSWELFDGTTIQLPYPITADTSLTAVWKDPVSTVTLDANGGTFSDGSSQKTVEFLLNSTIASEDKLDQPTKEGSVFKDWALNGEEITYPFTLTDLAYTFVAIWEENPGPEPGPTPGPTPTPTPTPEPHPELPNMWIPTTDGHWYFEDDNGNPVTDAWKEIDGKTYKFDSKGYALQDEWYFENGKWYYFGGDCSMEEGTWRWINNRWYAFNWDGSVCTGWFWDNDYVSWYYAYSDGAVAYGSWDWIDGAWYGFNWDCSMCTGWIWDNSYHGWYYCYSSGDMARNAWIHGNYVNNTGRWVR